MLAGDAEGNCARCRSQCEFRQFSAVAAGFAATPEKGTASRQYLFTQAGAFRIPGSGSNSARTRLRFAFASRFMSSWRQSRALLREFLLPGLGTSGHPGSEPYFREFLPLIRKAGGVRLFVPEIPYRWFIPVGGVGGRLRPEEQKYLALLLRRASRCRKIPVFGFSRSLARLAAIKKQFSGFIFSVPKLVDAVAVFFGATTEW